MEGLAEAEEIVMCVRHVDGRWSARPIWVVVIDGAAYVRSAFGLRSGWCRRALAGAETAVELDGVTVPVRLTPVDEPALVERVSGAYRAKYGLSWPGPVLTITGPEAAGTTMRLADAGEVS
ncbi:DUF2255 family protein [Nonomuraea sp. NPDC050783]|uniref:DUF2255 family protein n=1 Tax=Nonomuraea sp. NPDC050783 TaxID=3154634 RepID=UPI0034666A0D